MSDGKVEHTVSSAGRGPSTVGIETYSSDVSTSQGTRTLQDEIRTGRNGGSETLSINIPQTDQEKGYGIRGEELHSVSLKDGQVAAYDGKPANQLSATERAQAAALESQAHQALGNHSIQAAPVQYAHEDKAPAATASVSQPVQHSRKQ